MLKSVELFAGAGGLGMGVSLAGFEPVAVLEWDRWACDTIRHNKERDFPLVSDWPLWEGDVREFDWDSVGESVDLVSGGPPCQPFSLGGKHKAFGDKRDMFPASVEVVRRLQPKAFIFENVKGLTRTRFANYYQYILLQLEFPEVCRRDGETWLQHYKRLQSEKTSGELHRSGLTYNVVPTLINSADFGVPQRRERVFIVGFRSDLGVEWSSPNPTHSLESLLWDQWVSEEYWKRHSISVRKRPDLPKRFRTKVMQLEKLGDRPGGGAWRTVRDSLSNMPNPRGPKARSYFDHRFQAGAKVYPGHTGSPMDLPAKTLKAGDHGVPGGENMMVLDNGAVRYFTVRESARLQTFPDGYRFHGSWTETMRQLGNAVPVALARIIASSVAEQLAISGLRNLEKIRQQARA
jgi:DNA (cytosine-5)-methyltransferase 1